MPFSDRSSILNPLSSPALDIAAAKFVVGIMAEPHEVAKAVRLLESCKARGIPAVLHEVPAVHCSISMGGSDDLSCTRPSFIRYLLDKHRKPVLYLDSGCVMADSPSAILSMVDERVDFAAFNWLAEEHTEAYSPLNIRAQEGLSVVVTSDRYYRYTHSIDLYDPSQLLSSTHVLFWNDSDDARTLLKAWQDLIARVPRSPDAHALDFAFNYRGTAVPRLKTAWLDKRYMRMGWWIYVKPVIDHPDFFPVHAWTESLEVSEGLPRFDARKFKTLEVDCVFPKDCVIDTVEKTLVRPNFQNGFDVIGPLPVPIWITRY